MPKPLPSIEFLRRVICYDAETGRLTWLPRTPDMFAGATEAIRRRACAWWNCQYAGKPALVGIDGYGYYHGPIAGRYLKAHRVAWALHYGEWPRFSINHDNGDRRDNRIINLRDLEHRACHQNVRLSVKNTSGVAGVSWNRRMNRWQAFIKRDGKTRCLGTFETIDDAAAARTEAQIELGYHPNHGQRRASANHFIPAGERHALQADSAI
jgi:hypothetical protein